MVDDRLPGALQATFWPAPRIPSDGHLALWGLRAGGLDVAPCRLGLPTDTVLAWSVAAKLALTAWVVERRTGSQRGH